MDIKIISSTPMTTTLSRCCPFCGAEQQLIIATPTLERGLDLYRRGALIQIAFPTLSPNMREFFKTGICPTCWSKM